MLDKMYVATLTADEWSDLDGLVRWAKPSALALTRLQACWHARTG
jgi:hypothetical protein